MSKFIANSRTINGFKLNLVVTRVNRIPRKIKKQIKAMAKRVSTIEILNYIVNIK